MLSLLAVTVAATCAAHAPTWPPIDDDVGSAGGGQHDAAVVVGISAYYDLPRIDGARENAEAWQQYLLRVRKVPSHQVFTFLDKQGEQRAHHHRSPRRVEGGEARRHVVVRLHRARRAQ